MVPNDGSPEVKRLKEDCNLAGAEYESSVRAVSKVKTSASSECISDETILPKVETSDNEEVEHKETSMQNEEIANESAEDKKVDNITVTTAVESLEDQIDYESNCEGKELSVRVNGTLFRGIKSSTDSSHLCEMDGCNKILIGKEETLKERNRRLLRKERESVRQRKVRPSKRRGKCTSCSHISQETEENNTAAVEDPGDERINGTVENISGQKETTRVDRRWELELLSRMKEKLLKNLRRA